MKTFEVRVFLRDGKRCRGALKKVKVKAKDFKQARQFMFDNLSISAIEVPA